MENGFSLSDRNILRTLAGQVAELAADPANGVKKELWKRHNAMRAERPIIMVNHDDLWDELWPQPACEDEQARAIEAMLQARIMRHRFVPDDVPIVAEVPVQKAINNTLWGVKPRYIMPAEAHGARRHSPIIEEPEDWQVLKPPVVTHDERESQRRFACVQDAIGDLLPVKLAGIKRLSAHLLHWYCDFRGLDNLFFDLYDDPDTVHRVMRFFTDGVKSMWQQYEAQNLISLNDDATQFYTGGLGYTDELPASGFNPDAVRLCDVWGAAEAQEFSSVGPEMHEEFVLQYERELLEPFGLTGYGCCDDLSQKLDGVLKINHLRRVAVCPWADIAQFTPRLQKNYIMTWKPNPAHMSHGEFNAGVVREELETGLEKARGGNIELILRDLHTCRGQVERFGWWLDIARKAIDKVWR